MKLLLLLITTSLAFALEIDSVTWQKIRVKYFELKEMTAMDFDISKIQKKDGNRVIEFSLQNREEEKLKVKILIYDSSLKVKFGEKHACAINREDFKNWYLTLHEYTYTEKQGLKNLETKEISLADLLPRKE